MPQFYTVLTDIGQSKLANAVALGQTIEITQLAVGDGGGSLPTPETIRTALVNEVRRAAINLSEVDDQNPSWVVVEQVLPPDVGGWTIREVGIFDVDGDLIGYGNYPETYKPVLAEGSSRTQTIRFVMEVSDTAAVTLKVDPSVVLATRGYADGLITDHEASRNHPAGTTSAKGMLRLATAERVKQYNAADPVTAAVLRDSGFLGAAVNVVTSTDSPKALVVAEAGLVLVDASAGTVDITLPAAADSEGVRYTLLRLDSEANLVTVTPDGADMIDGAATMELAAGDRRGLVSDGVNAWLRPAPLASEGVAGLIKLANDSMVLDGLDAESAVTPAGLASFGKSLAARGYQKLPGGLILQWGSETNATTAGSNTSFPVAFPTACLNVLLTDHAISAATVSSQGVDKAPTTTSFLVYASNDSDAPNYFWLAIGY